MEKSDLMFTLSTPRYAIPQFVRDMLARSAYEFDRCVDDPRFAPGYTISIESADSFSTPLGAMLGKAKFMAELRRLCHWADSHGSFGTAHILGMPVLTTHNTYVATVSIYDPVMSHIEKFIPKHDSADGDDSDFDDDAETSFLDFLRSLTDDDDDENGDGIAVEIEVIRGKKPDDAEEDGKDDDEEAGNADADGAKTGAEEAEAEDDAEGTDKDE